MESYYESLQPLRTCHDLGTRLAQEAPQNRDVSTSNPDRRKSQNSRGQEGRQKRIACRECRQSKLRCEGASGHDMRSCTRCHRLSLECHIDVSYKRINKRNKLNELVEQVEQLRSAANAVAAQCESPTNVLAGPERDLVTEDARAIDNPISSLENQDNLYQISPYPAIDDTQQPQDSSPMVIDFASQSPPVPQDGSTSSPINSVPGTCESTQYLMPSSTKSRRLENVELTDQEISDLFLIFFQYYHHYLEILDSSLSPNQYYDQSPLLFWSIISVAARLYENDVALLGSLSPCVTSLIWSIIPVLPHSPYTIQAIVLVSIWPFPTSSLSTDISFMLVSISRSASMQLGLHRPESIQDYMRIKTNFSQREFQNAIRIWAGCYIAAQSVTSATGQPSAFSDDWALSHACDIGNKYTLPDNLRHHVIIHKYLARVNTVMAENDQPMKNYPSGHENSVLMAMLERDLLDLDREIGHKLSASGHILLSIAALQLRTYYFFTSPSTEVRRQGLLRAYASAVTLIEEVTSADSMWSFTNYAPSRYMQMIAVAAMLQLKIINSSYAPYVDVKKGKRTFNTALALLRRASMEDNDLLGRVSKIIAQLWTFHHSLVARREQEPSLNINTRGSASLLHDLLWMWREEFGGQSSTVADSDIAAKTSTLPLTMRPSDTGCEDMHLTVDRHDRDDDWSSETISSHPQESPLPIAAVSMGTDLDSFANHSFGNLQEPQWMSEIGLASLLPIDIDLSSDMTRRL